MLLCQCSGFGAISFGGRGTGGSAGSGNTNDDTSLGGTSTPPEFNYFSFTTTATQGVISGDTIAVKVPAATNLASLVANFKTDGAVRVGANHQTTRVTANNFTTPVVYTLTGTNGATRTYTVTVTPTSADIFAPAITSITTTPAAVSTFPATITLKAYYDEAGSGFSYGYLFFCGDNDKKILVASTTNMGSYLQGTVTLQNYHPSGTWRLCSMSMSDNAGNSSSYYAVNSASHTNYSVGYPDMDSGVPFGGIVTVSGTIPDTIKPVITSVTATPSSVNTFPATITVRVNYTETGSGYSYGHFSLCSPTKILNTDAGSTVYGLSTTNFGTYFQGTVTLQNYHEAGTWKVCSVSISDLASNYNDYDLRPSLSTAFYSLDYTTVSGVPVGGAITATGTTQDTTAPVVTSVTATPSSTSTYPATVTVRVYYSETGSGYYSASLSLCSPSKLTNSIGAVSVSASSITNAGAYIQGTVTLQSYHETGTWKVCNISINDAADNSTQLSVRNSYSTTYYTSNSTVTNIPIGGAVVKN